MDVHVLTPRGAELVVQVVDGRVIVPEGSVEERPPCTIEASCTQSIQRLTPASGTQL